MEDYLQHTIYIIIIAFLLIISGTLYSSNQKLISNTNITIDTNISSDEYLSLFEKMDNIKLSCPSYSCPSCNCPKYEKEECVVIETIIKNNNSLLIDKAKFRISKFKDEYKILEDKLEDHNDNKYCNENIVELKDDFDLAYSYIYEYVSKEEFEKDSNVYYSYEILKKGNTYFYDYLEQLRIYCHDNNNDIDESENYDFYEDYITYYNNLSSDTILPDMEILNNINVD